MGNSEPTRKRNRLLIDQLCGELKNGLYEINGTVCEERKEDGFCYYDDYYFWMIPASHPEELKQPHLQHLNTH